jgi:hypothetical protein
LTGAGHKSAWRAEGLVGGRRPIPAAGLWAGIQTVLIPHSAITLPGAHDAALQALSAIRGIPQASKDGGPQAPGVVDTGEELAAMRQMLSELKDLYQGGRPA